MIIILRIFYGARGTKPWFVLGCLLLAGISEGVGLATLLPLLSLAIDDRGGESSAITIYMEDALGYFGLTPDLSLLIGLVVGGIAVKCVLHMVAMRYVGYAVAAVATDLRAELIKSLLNVRWEYFTKQPLDRKSTRLNSSQ